MIGDHLPQFGTRAALDEVVREGARRTLLAALEDEVRSTSGRTQTRAGAWSHRPSDTADNALSDSTTRSGRMPVGSKRSTAPAGIRVSVES